MTRDNNTSAPGTLLARAARPLDLLGAAATALRFAWALFRRGRLTRRGAYVRWRWQTAFGRSSPGREEALADAIGYAAWASKMRRMR